MAALSWKLNALNFTHGDVGRVVVLGADTLLVQVGDPLQIRVWDPVDWGRVWAAWPATPQGEST